MISGCHTLCQTECLNRSQSLCLFPLIYSMLKPEIGAPGPPGPSPGPPRPPRGGPPGTPPDPGNLLLGSVKMTPFGGVPPKWAKMAILGHFGGVPGGPKKGPKRAVFGVENRPRNWPQKGPIFDLILAPKMSPDSCPRFGRARGGTGGVILTGVPGPACPWGPPELSLTVGYWGTPGARAGTVVTE